jgi:DNA invertase Pin-like site-specific DNA recombinase
MDNSTKCYSYIRFSNEKQKEGDSLRRQIDLSEKFVKLHELTLDTKLNMHDLGFSAYKGDHIKKGALGHFIKLVNNGDIKHGSTLLVESLDRLSREDILTAFNQFVTLLQNGITIATLQDNQIYTPESINQNTHQLMLSLSIMARAHEESKIKSNRLSASWSNKRENAKNVKLTATCPKWMNLSSDRKEFILIPERAQIIQSIFNNYLKGNGLGLIAKTLNRSNVKTWGRGKLWWESYIGKILRSRSVIGEYQPHSMDEKGKRKKVGDAIKDYYPTVITDEVFYKVQDQLSLRQINYGKIGQCANLFSHIAKCQYCGSSMVYVNKGKQGGKEYKYLVCDDARRGGKCTYFSIPYAEFENAFLVVCHKLNINDIVVGTQNVTKKKIIDLEDILNTTSHKIRESNEKIAGMLDFLGETNKSVQKTLRQEIENEHIIVEDLETLKKDKELELSTLKNKDTKKDLEYFQQNMELLTTFEGDELFVLRKRIKHELQNLIDRIELAPSGPLYNIPIIVKDMKKYGATESAIKKMINGLEVENKNLNRSHRSFTIRFKDGGVIVMRYNSSTEQFEKSVEIDEKQDIIHSSFTLK